MVTTSTRNAEGILLAGDLIAENTKWGYTTSHRRGKNLYKLLKAGWTFTIVPEGM